MLATLGFLVPGCNTEGAGTPDAPTGGPDAVSVDGTLPSDAPSPDAPPTALALTSTAITEGGTIPTMYSCRGTNVSPPLAWSGGPAAQGYAVVLTDLTGTPFIHSVIWDIPGSVTSLPENVAKVAEPPVPAGSKQARAYDNQTRGYLGPCPGSMHTYEFALYAVGTYPLPGVTLSSTRAQVQAALLANQLESARLTATFTP
jgi:Raf kinase inhibitor-like YbhB/YbcL family protein